MITNNIRRKNNGITLIALVITIIILLILAGVSIAMLTGNNGILTQAKNAKENTAAAEEKENQDLEKINSYINEKTIKDNYTDVNGDKATIPEGFTIDETEKTISKGLVVHGPDKVNGDNGSEFVWIPVPDINSMAQCSKVNEDNCNLKLENGTLRCKTHNDNEEIVGKLYSIQLTYKNDIDSIANKTYKLNDGEREPAIITGGAEGNGTAYDKNVNYNNGLFTLKSLQEEYINMANSVAKYGGFYIGRYETSLIDATEGSSGTKQKAQSKQGVLPAETQNSETLSWYGLFRIQDGTYTGKNNSVKSSMIWGSQYDAMINWAKQGEDKAKTTDSNLGNCSGKEISITGNKAYADDCINNIRDLAGNVLEWTLEAYTSSFRIRRGGSCDGAYAPSFRSDFYSTDTTGENGSRMTLYIK